MQKKDSVDSRAREKIRIRSFGFCAAILLFLFSLITFVSGCHPIQKNPTQEHELFGSTIVTKGGDQTLAGGMNLKNITAKQDGDFLTITFSFVKGSRLTGNEESTVTGLPGYEIFCRQQPRRMVISFDGVDFWDYQDQGIFGDSNLVYGSFRTLPMEGQSFQYHLQLGSDVEYGVEEKESQLILRLRSQNKPDGDVESGDGYYVLLNAFDQYEEGLVQQDAGLTPTLCEDNRLALISERFPSLEEAEQFQEKTNREISQSIPAKQAYVQQIFGDALPQYDAEADLKKLEKRAVLSVGGKEVEIPSIIQNASYLCTAPNGNRIFVRTTAPDQTIDTEQAALDTLWIVEATGKKYELKTDEAFFGINRGAFSFDGRYLAFLDITYQESILYLYDFQTGALINAGEEGFGSRTSGFVWAENQNILYAMTGSAGLQLIQYNLTGEQATLSPIEELQGAEGSLGISGNKLYFSDALEGEIWSVGITDGMRAKFADGQSFVISPDGRYMALSRMIAVDEAQVSMDTLLINLTTGEQSMVAQHKLLESVAFAADSSKLFYTYEKEGATQPYSYALEQMEIGSKQTSEIGLSTTPTVFLDGVSGDLLLVDNIEFEESYIPVTYRYQPQ